MKDPIAETQGARPSARVLGWVTRIERDQGYSFVTGIDGQEYFAHARNYATVHWKALELQDGVSFEPVDTLKGWRAARVRAADGDEGKVIHGCKEGAGNR